MANADSTEDLLLASCGKRPVSDLVASEDDECVSSSQKRFSCYWFISYRL